MNKNAFGANIQDQSSFFFQITCSQWTQMYFSRRDSFQTVSGLYWRYSYTNHLPANHAYFFKFRRFGTNLTSDFGFSDPENIENNLPSQPIRLRSTILRKKQYLVPFLLSTKRRTETVHESHFHLVRLLGRFQCHWNLMQCKWTANMLPQTVKLNLFSTFSLLLLYKIGTTMKSFRTTI